VNPTAAPFPSSITLEHEVRDVMTPGVVSIPADAPIRRVHETMLAHGTHAVLVVDRETGGPVGWVTARGLLRWAACVGTVTTAKQAISEPARTISPRASVREALAMLLDEDVSHLLVAHPRSRMPEGVVAEIDIVRIDGRH
jgi:CBS domain-containing protein